MKIKNGAFTDFLQSGELEKDGLKELASYGYYYSDTNYMLTLQSFCKGEQYLCLQGNSMKETLKRNEQLICI